MAVNHFTLFIFPQYLLQGKKAAPPDGVADSLQRFEWAERLGSLHMSSVLLTLNTTGPYPIPLTISRHLQPFGKEVKKNKKKKEKEKEKEK